MKEASKRRRSVGKLGILAAAAIVLPLTATIVPAVTAQDTAATEEAIPTTTQKRVKVVKISIGTVVDGKPKGSVVRTISRDGTSYVFHSDKPLSDKEMDKLIVTANTSRVEAEQSRVEAEQAGVEAEQVRIEAEQERIEADGAKSEADGAWASAEVARAQAEVARVRGMAFAASYVPDIDISKITRECKNGEPGTTTVESFNGKNRSRAKVVMCSARQARFGRMEAIKGLREARAEIASNGDMPKSVRTEVLGRLEQQIRKLEAQADKAV